MKFLVAALVALTLVGSAQAHNKFVQGKASAVGVQRALNASNDYDGVICRYVTPHVICAGKVKWGKTDLYLKARLTFHKTAPKKGYSMTCIIPLDFCFKEQVAFSL